MNRAVGVKLLEATNASGWCSALVGWGWQCAHVTAVWDRLSTECVRMKSGVSEVVEGDSKHNGMPEQSRSSVDASTAPSDSAGEEPSPKSSDPKSGVTSSGVLAREERSERGLLGWQSEAAAANNAASIIGYQRLHLLLRSNKKKRERKTGGAE